MRVGAIFGSILFLFMFTTTAVAGVKPGNRKGPSHDISISQNVNNSEQSEQQPAEWDPASCWDCTTPEEPVALFFVGLFCTIPISVWGIRRKTRKIELLEPKRYLEI
jgi:hypothetical protein